MSEMMYVVQLEIYFRRGTTVEQAEKAIKPLADVCPFPIRVERSSQEEASVRELEFVDNIGGFDPKEFQNVVRKVLEKDATATNSISIMGAYYWEMDPDEPTWHKSFTARNG